MGRSSLRRSGLVLILCVLVLVAVACGTEAPTPTPPSTPTPTPVDSAGAAPQVTATPTTAPTPTTEQERDLTAYFAGKQVTLVVGYSPGGGYDTFSRLFALFAPRYLPGSPQIVIQNLPGSGGELGLREALTSPADGLTLGILHPRFAKRELLGTDVPDFDLNTVVMIGSPTAAPSPSQYYSRRSIATSWTDVEALGREVTNGETEVGASSGLAPEFIELTGGPMRTVYGYGGTSEIVAAVDRGELDGASSGLEAAMELYPEWAAEQYIVPLFWWGASPEEDPLTMDIYNQLGVSVPPNIFDLVSANETQRAVFDLTFATNTVLSRTFVLPPGTPDDVVEAWRSALAQVMEDQEFVEAANLAGYQVGFGEPEALREHLLEGLAQIEADPEFRELFEALAHVD